MNNNKAVKEKPAKLFFQDPVTKLFAVESPTGEKKHLTYNQVMRLEQLMQHSHEIVIVRWVDPTKQNKMTTAKHGKVNQ